MGPLDTILMGLWGLERRQTAWELETVIDRRLPLNPLRWSLKGQIRALGVMVFATVVLGVLLLRQSQSARVADASRPLDRAVDQLAERYAYLRRSFDERHAVAPLAAGDESLLRSLTEATLASAPGVEGGFYRAADRRLLGYAYPTYYGSGPKTDLPEAERPTIQRVVETAVDRGMLAAERVLAGPDLILFRARPLSDAGDPMGAAWAMQRLAGVQTAPQQLYRIGLLGLLVVSGTTAVAAWFLTRRLDRGVSRVEEGLRTMAERLDTPVPATGIPELDRVGAAINQLARTVQAHQQGRADLERRLHRADRLAALGRLVGGVAHEVRSPLASIKLKLPWHAAREPMPTAWPTPSPSSKPRWSAWIAWWRDC